MVDLDLDDSVLGRIVCQTQIWLAHVLTHVEAQSFSLIRVEHPLGMSRGWEGCKAGEGKR